MTENKRFKRVYAMRYGQIGITDELHNCGDKWFPKNLTEDETVDLLNQLNDENNQLKQGLKDDSELIGQLQKENKQLLKELYESERDYFTETYHDNPVRAEGKIKGLDEDFRERFGENEWWKND